MTKWKKFGLVSLIVVTLAAVKVAFFPSSKQAVEQQPAQEEEQVAKPPEDLNENVPKSYVSLYFIGQNKNKEEVYKVVKRAYKPGGNGTKLKFSVESLLKGPTSKENAKGIYSEIPSGVKLLFLEEKPDKIIVNLSSDFENGGGTEGIYKRLYQLIKTVNKNTTLDVYLYIDGKQADVIGGEGIMINQPLNEKSLDE